MDKITIGRNKASTIVVEPSYGTVSKNHAEIQLINGEIVFTDRSSNGTIINGQKLHHNSQVIKETDVIMLAGVYELNWSMLGRYLPEDTRIVNLATTYPSNIVTPYPSNIIINNTSTIANNNTSSRVHSDTSRNADPSLVNSFLMAHSQELPKDKINWIRERLTQLNDNQISALSMIEFKNPTTALILSLFLGELGMDRFYIGSIGLGLLKLLTLGGFGVLAFIDWFAIMGATRRQNLNTLTKHLGML